MVLSFKAKKRLQFDCKSQRKDEQFTCALDPTLTCFVRLKLLGIGWQVDDDEEEEWRDDDEVDNEVEEDDDSGKIEKEQMSLTEGGHSRRAKRAVDSKEATSDKPVCKYGSSCFRFV